MPVRTAVSMTLSVCNCDLLWKTWTTSITTLQGSEYGVGVRQQLHLAPLSGFTHNRRHRIKLSFTETRAMSKPHISEELKTFIKDKIQTVLRLEVLLLLHDQQFRSFTADEI